MICVTLSANAQPVDAAQSLSQRRPHHADAGAAGALSPTAPTAAFGFTTGGVTTVLDRLPVATVEAPFPACGTLEATIRDNLRRLGYGHA